MPTGQNQKGKTRNQGGRRQALPPDQWPEKQDCIKCGETKKLEEFPPDKRMAYGRRNNCRQCETAMHRGRLLKSKVNKALADPLLPYIAAARVLREEPATVFELYDRNRVLWRRCLREVHEEIEAQLASNQKFANRPATTARSFRRRERRLERTLEQKEAEIADLTLARFLRSDHDAMDRVLNRYRYRFRTKLNELKREVAMKVLQDHQKWSKRPQGFKPTD